MKRYEKIVQYGLFITAITIVCAIGLKKLTKHLFTVERVVFSVDSLIAADCQQQVVAVVNEYKDQFSFHPKEVIALLQHQFPWIKSVVVSYVPTNVIQMVIRAHEPICIINHAQVLLTNDIRVEPIVYNAAYLVPLPNVTVDGDREDSDLLRALLQHIPAHLLSSYELEWVNEMKILLHDKHQRKFAIVCDSARLPDDALLARCNTIKYDLEKRGTFTKNTKKLWVADVRFENQIVVSGGTYDGKSIS